MPRAALRRSQRPAAPGGARWRPLIALGLVRPVRLRARLRALPRLRPADADGRRRRARAGSSRSTFASRALGGHARARPRLPARPATARNPERRFPVALPAARHARRPAHGVRQLAARRPAHGPADPARHAAVHRRDAARLARHLRPGDRVGQRPGARPALVHVPHARRRAARSTRTSARSAAPPTRGIGGYSSGADAAVNAILLVPHEFGVAEGWSGDYRQTPGDRRPRRLARAPLLGARHGAAAGAARCRSTGAHVYLYAGRHDRVLPATVRGRRRPARGGVPVRARRDRRRALVGALGATASTARCAGSRIDRARCRA